MAKTKLFDPDIRTPFPLSRSKVELFLECARCFYLDRRLGITRPSGPPYTLNSAVDTLLKKEFDAYRAAGTPHLVTRTCRCRSPASWAAAAGRPLCAGHGAWRASAAA